MSFVHGNELTRSLFSLKGVKLSEKKEKRGAKKLEREESRRMMMKRNRQRS